MLTRSHRAPRPDTAADQLARTAKFAKPRHCAQAEPVDTSELQHRKMHPARDDAYKAWLRTQSCAIKGLVDKDTDQPHVCWHPNQLAYNRYASDPAHTGKAYSGRLKRSDRECIPLCRHAHDLQEDRMNAFDARFGINRFDVAAECYARFAEEQERKGIQ